MKKLLFFLFIALSLIAPKTSFAGGLNVPENVKLDRLECTPDSKVYAYIKWDTAAGATSYKYYVREKNGKFSDKGDDVSDTQYKAGLGKNVDHIIAITSVNAFYGNNSDKQNTESEKSKELEITKEEIEEACKKNIKPTEKPEPTPTSKTNPTHIIAITTPTSTTSARTPEASASPNIASDSAKKEADEQIAKMQKKIETLEKKVEQSDQKISGLEKTIQNLKSFISSLFSFNK